jgi:hypothetical protein
VLLLATALVLSVLLCLPAWYLAQKRKSWHPVDYVTTLAALPIWILLSAFQLGHQSMGNLIEIPAILIFPPLLLTAKVALGKRLAAGSEKASIVTFLILVALIGAVRMFTPEIPE